MIDKLYSKYFQKSKSFLYPALGIKRNQYAPSGTYMSLEGKIGAEEMKLLCTFKNNESEKFKIFEQQMLLTNPLFVNKIQIKDYNIYVFDMEIYQNDWFNFIMGKYSKLSIVLKKAIKTFYGESTPEYKVMETYLYPDKFFQDYADLLEIDVETLEKIGELCDPCDLEKETLKIPAEDLELLNKN